MASKKSEETKPETKPETKSKLLKVGALWLKRSKAIPPVTFMSGEIELDGKTVRLMVFKNGFKKEDKHPDYLIYTEPVSDGNKAENDSQVDIPF